MQGTQREEEPIEPERKRKGRFVLRKVVALGRRARESAALWLLVVEEPEVELVELAAWTELELPDVVDD